MNVKKTRQTDNNRKRSARSSARDIYPIPQCKDIVNRVKCDQSLLYFLKHCFKQRFYNQFGQAHLQLIKSVQNIIQNGGVQSLGCSRGSGKSTILRLAVLWAAITGRRKYSLFISLNAKQAKQANQAITIPLKTNQILYDLYPQVCYPIWRLQGSTGRARSQLYKGKPTALVFGKMICFAAVGGIADNCVININSISSGIRGQSATSVKGQSIRPSFILIDDIVNDKTANSPQVQQGLQHTIQNSIMYLAGPGVKLSVAFVGTVVSKHDVFSKYLNRKLKPQWRGIRMPALYSMPTNMKLWQKYKQMLFIDIENGDQNKTLSKKFYLDNRQELDKGAKASWQFRKDDCDISAIHHAMRRWSQNQSSFFNQYQLDPIQQVKGTDRLKVQQLQGKYSNLKRGQIPNQPCKIHLGVDINDPALSWVVTAQTESTTYVVDYGFTPQSPQRYFKMSQHKNPMSRRFPANSISQSIKMSLQFLIKDLLEKYNIDTCLVDRGYDVSITSVTQICDKYKNLTQMIYLPAKGHAFPRTSLTTFADSKPKQGQTVDKSGLWRISKNINGIFIQHQTNMNKDNLSQKIRNGRLLLYKPDDLNLNHHRLFIQHCLSQYPVWTQAIGGYKNNWQKDSRFKGQDHLWDALLLTNIGSSLISNNKIATYKKKQEKKIQSNPFTFKY